MKLCARRLALALAALAALSANVTSRADSYTWSGGAGTWDTSATNWLSSGGTVAWPSSGIDNDGVFGGPANTVTLSGGVLANELLFSAAGYTVSGAGTLTLNGTSPTLTVTTGSATIGNNTALVLAGSDGLTKAGAGTLTLNSSVVSTLTGGVTVTGGTLAVNFANLATPTNMLPVGNALSLTNAAINVVGKNAAVVTSQTFAGLSIGSGLSTVALTRTTGTLQLDVGTVTQSAPGGVVSFQGSITTTSPVKVANPTNAYIGSWAISGDPRTSGARWAFVNASGTLTTVTGSASGVNWVNVTSATTVYTATNSVTLAANATAFGVQNNEAANRTITLGNFTFTTNGISKIQPNTDIYTAGSGTGSIVVGAGNELVMMGVGNITISAPIVNGTAGNSAVTYVGGGTLQFDTKASTYTGPTTVNSGVVRISTGGSINASSGIAVNGGRFVQANTATAVTPAVTLRSGTVDGTGTITTLTVADASAATVTNGDGTTTALTVGSLTFNGDGTINVNTAGSAGLTVTGALTTTPANGTVTINVPTAPVWVTGSTYNLIGYGSWSGSASDLTKGTIAGLGGRQVATLGSTGSTSGFVTLAITGDSVVWTGSTSNLWTTATTALDWRLQTAGTPTSFIATDDVRFDDTATGSTSVDIANANVSPNSTVFDNTTKTYVLSSGSGFGIASGFVTKNGSGLVRFDTANTYTGATTINGGTLALNSGAAIANSGLVTLADAAGATLQVLVSETIGTLSGGGGTGGTVDIATGQTLAVSSGTQTYSGAVSGAGTLANTGAVQTINGVISSSGGVVVSAGRLNLGGSNSYTGPTSVAAGAAVVVTADGALGAIGTGNDTVLSGSGGAVAGVLGLSAVNYTVAEKVSGVGVGNTAAVSGLGAVQRGIVQGVSGSSRFAGNVEISASGVTRFGTQNGAVLNLAGSIAPASGVTGVTPLFRAGDTNGDFVILSGTGNSWDTDTAVFTGNNTAGQYAGLRLGASNALPSNVGIYGSSSAGVGNTFDLNGFDQTLNGLTSITQPTGGVAQLRITNLAAGGTSTLTLNVTAARSTTLTTLQEVAGGGVLALVKTGTGTQSLGGTNTYSGRTTVSAGTLQFTKAVALYGGTAANWMPAQITVESGAVLGLTVGGTTGEFSGSDVGTLATNLTTGVNNNGLRAGSFLGLAVASPTTVSTVLADSVGTGGGAVGIVKSGASTLTLDQANTFSGGLRVIDGFVTVANDSALGSGAVTLAEATKRLALANGVTLGNAIALDAGAAGGVAFNGLIQNANAAAGENVTLTGTITVNAAPGSGGHFASQGTGSTLTLLGPIVSATTRVVQRIGTVVYAGGGSYADLDITGSARLGANDGLSTSATVSLGLSGAGTLDLAGRSQTLVGLVRSSSSTATVGNSSTTSDSTLTIVGSSTFAGVIQDAVAGGTRTVGLVVNNPGGRFELSGSNTYTGATTIKGGTLAVGAAGSIGSSALIIVGDAGSTGSVLDLVATGGVAFGASQVVGGSGTIAGAVTFGSGATVSPGNSPGTLTVGDVTFAAGGNYNWQLFDSASSAGAGWDLLSGTGALTIASSTATPFRINLWTLSGTGPDVNGDALNFDGSISTTWTIASFTGGILGFDPSVFQVITSATNGTGGFTNVAPGIFGVAQSGNALQLVYTAVPEPASLALACAGGAAIGLIARRRRR
jgi:autotransporter-associated beta strand protein